jgi:hypothetical protein
MILTVGADGSVSGPTTGFCSFEDELPMLVIVTITPPGAPVRGGAGGLDLSAEGLALHCVWSLANTSKPTRRGFFRPSEFLDPDNGKGLLDRFAVKSDDGTYLITRPVRLSFAGGAVGSIWDVDVVALPITWDEALYNVPPEARRFTLTRYVAASGSPITIPTGHSGVVTVSGSISVGGTSSVGDVASPPLSGGFAPLTAGSNNTIVQSKGIL